jgi:DsbC/DsbD-like thiol-disulfide interchange protein
VSSVDASAPLSGRKPEGNAGRGEGRYRASAGGLLLLLALVSGAARPLELGAQPVVANLWAERDGIVPGQPFTLGLHLAHAAGWHSYWTVPGDSGLPTRVNWHLPPGIRAGPLQWPAPKRLPIGPLVDYGYEGDTLLLTELQAAPDLLPGGELRIEAHAQWLMCRDVCIPASQDLALTLPLRPQGALRPTEHAAAFGKTRERIPHDRKLAGAYAVRNGARITLTFVAPSSAVPHRLEFFPLESGRIDPSAPQTVRSDGNTVLLELTAAQPLGADFRRLHGVLAADGGSDGGGWIGTIDVPLTARATE